MGIMYNYLLYLKLFATQAFVPSLTCRNRTTNHLSGEMLYMYVTIELLGLRWQRECYNVYWFICVTYVLLIRQSWTSKHRSLLSVIWVLVAQWNRASHWDQKVAGSIPVSGAHSETFWVCDKAWAANSSPLNYQAWSHFIYLVSSISCCLCNLKYPCWWFTKIVHPPFTVYL